MCSDVIKDFVLEDKAKAKDTGPEDENKDLQKQQGQGKDVDKDKDLEPRTRMRTRTWSRGQRRGLETKFKTKAKNSRSKPITSKRPYHNDTVPVDGNVSSTGVTLVRFCTFWTSLVVSYYWNSPTMQNISDKQKNWHFVTLAIPHSVSSIFCDKLSIYVVFMYNFKVVGLETKLVQWYC